jgi:hypothetical protein
MDDELEKRKNYTPTKEEVGRINAILAIGDAFLVIEKYLVGCLVLIKACKQVILEKIKLSNTKAIDSNDKET